MNQHLPGTRSRPGTRCGRHSCPNSRRSPARIGLGTIDMGREARPGRYLQPGPNPARPNTPDTNTVAANRDVRFMMGSLREARRVCSCNDIFSPKSSLVSSSGLLEYAAGQTGVHSLHKRRLPVEEPQLERAGRQRAGARVVRVQDAVGPPRQLQGPQHAHGGVVSAHPPSPARWARSGVAAS